MKEMLIWTRRSIQSIQWIEKNGKKQNYRKKDTEMIEQLK